jgi:hypothetical protein
MSTKWLVLLAIKSEEFDQILSVAVALDWE